VNAANDDSVSRKQQMTADMKIRQGTAAWFEMMGTLMSEAALSSQAAVAGPGISV